MSKCPNCSLKVNESWKHCPKCGFNLLPGNSTENQPYSKPQQGVQSQQVNSNEAPEKERAEALARFKARSRGETIESDGPYSPNYAGFWSRFVANLIDIIILNIITIPAYILVYFTTATWIISIIEVVYVIGFWALKGQTPGKIALGIQIVTVDGEEIGLGRSIIRYFGYILSGLILCIGFLMIAWDKKKQGLHDKIAGTIVVHN